jgi:hypothetical protein
MPGIVSSPYGIAEKTPQSRGNFRREFIFWGGVSPKRKTPQQEKRLARQAVKERQIENE